MRIRPKWELHAATLAAMFWATPSMASPWTQVGTGQMPGGLPANIALLTDGRILLSGQRDSTSWNLWWVLTPDSTGAYENSTPVPVGSAPVGRVYGPSFTLSTGQYMACGGEYVCPANDLSCYATNPSTPYPNRSECELFDPTHNAWIVQQSMPQIVNDTESVTLSDGRPLIMTYNNDLTSNPDTAYLFNGVSWDLAAATYVEADAICEGGSILLPNGSVLVGDRAFGLYNADASQWTEAPSTAMLFPGATGQDDLTDVGDSSCNCKSNLEIGPFIMLFDGRALVLGGNQRNAFYSYTTNTWAPADDTPAPYNHADTPAAIEPSGNVLTVVTDQPNGHGDHPGVFYEFMPNNGPQTQWGPPLANPLSAGGGAGDDMKMLALPSGQILVAGYESSGNLYLYRPSGSPSIAAKPTIASVPYLMFGSFVLTARQLSGISNGADFGDDGKTATNFPIVTVTAPSGAITFARTFGFHQRAPEPNYTDTTLFTLPSGLAAAVYQLKVTASGVGSDSVSLTLPTQDLGPAINAAAQLPLL